ncbi:4'-phosphopantetheinyl transferase [Salinisphaera dokdonensis CL-ES53]|uniref:4'-phosphopantetheinyl transferase n=1 Tax=Salinisphaera dokdonensis CL-ES53 TaxID=1304272 RepID=A0ABV2B2K6_9GAMM
MVHVVYTFLPAVDQPLRLDWGADNDPPAYRERFERMASQGARSRSRTGLWLLQQLLMGAGYPGETLARIGFNPAGRPEIAGAPAFSISHSEALVACALCDEGMIGLDVEYRRPRDMTRMARLLDVAEQQHVAQQPLAFFDYWCAREATVKASGRVGLKRIRALTLHGDTAHLDARAWPLRALALADGYAACLASDRAIEAVEISDLSDRLAGNTGR